MTLVIILFHQLGLPVAIIIPQMTINTKDIIKITVTNILVKLHIKTGKAVVQVTLVSPGPGAEVPSSIQLPINGMDVLSDTPQQTPSSEQGLHTLLTFLNQGLHSQDNPPRLTIALGSVLSFEFMVVVHGVQTGTVEDFDLQPQYSEFHASKAAQSHSSLE